LRQDLTRFLAHLRASRNPHGSRCPKAKNYFADVFLRRAGNAAFDLHVRPIVPFPARSIVSLASATGRKSESPFRATTSSYAAGEINYVTDATG